MLDGKILSVLCKKILHAYENVPSWLEKSIILGLGKKMIGFGKKKTMP